MPGEYLTINESGQGEYVEKKSRFIAQAVHVESEEEAIAFLEKVRKKYYDARHNCYAYVLGPASETMRFSDDKEPQGTAGKPILAAADGEIPNVIQRSGCGFCAGAGDAQGLAAATEQFLACEDKEKLGENARQYYMNHFTRTMFMNHLERVLKEFATGNEGTVC